MQLWQKDDGPFRLQLSIEDAKPIGLYLGCHHDTETARHSDGTTVATMPYNMEDFLQSCVTRYEELSGGNARLQQVRIPIPQRKSARRASRQTVWHRAHSSVPLVQPQAPLRAREP